MKKLLTDKLNILRAMQVNNRSLYMTLLLSQMTDHMISIASHMPALFLTMRHMYIVSTYRVVLVGNVLKRLHPSTELHGSLPRLQETLSQRQ